MSHGRLLIIPTILVLASCGSARKHEVAKKLPQPTKSQPQAAPTTPVEGGAAVAPTASTVVAGSAAAGVPVSAKVEEKFEGIAPETALLWLKHGNVRFTKKRWRADGASAADRARLVSMQKPHSIVLACSDSRVPPEIVFDQKLGEIFVARSIGESLDSSTIASIEYAISHLGSRLIVVMGHENCGAVKMAVSSAPGASSGSPALDQVAASLKPHLKDMTEADHSLNWVNETAANARGVAADLMARSNLIRESVQSGKVQIKVAIYHLHSGVVDFE